MENVSFYTKVVGNVCVITIDNPSVNASSFVVRQELMSTIETLASNPKFKAGVLISAGNKFVQAQIFVILESLWKLRCSQMSFVLNAMRLFPWVSWEVRGMLRMLRFSLLLKKLDISRVFFCQSMAVFCKNVTNLNTTSA